mmetsp:Transcript_29285/g.53714  ORF Transcript_29285/g.53714 Transcript_29285/m.53714 type:complete len:159 (+) Transcript_29285:193-669(+)
MNKNTTIDVSPSGDLLPPSKLNQPKSLASSIPTHPATDRVTHPTKRDASSAAPNNKLSSSRSGNSATKATKQPPKKKAKPSTAYSLIWICSHGKGPYRKTWSKKGLQIVGIYATKGAAEEARRQVMSRHECHGNGDILVGCTWKDEIDLIIREGPLRL